MNETLSIPIGDLLLFLSLLFIPAGIISVRNRRLGRDLLIALIRMTLQLSLVGFYLQFLFDLNSPVVTILWVVVMVIIANTAIIQRAGLRRRKLFVPAFVGSLFVTAVVSLLLLFTVGVDPLWDAPYLIPLVGMVLGNVLQGNIIALDRFYFSLKRERATYELMLFNGANRSEALAPFRDRAVSAAISPSIGNMMTMGLVSLPGMMTGQILGGTVPVEAIKYQIAIMTAIFLSLFFSILVNIKLTQLSSFTSFGVLRSDIFRR